MKSHRADGKTRLYLIRLPLGFSDTGGLHPTGPLRRASRGSSRPRAGPRGPAAPPGQPRAGAAGPCPARPRRPGRHLAARPRRHLSWGTAGGGSAGSAGPAFARPLGRRNPRVNGAYRASGAAPEGRRWPARRSAWGPSPVPAVSRVRRGGEVRKPGQSFLSSNKFLKACGLEREGRGRTRRAGVPTCWFQLNCSFHSPLHPWAADFVLLSSRGESF